MAHPLITAALNAWERLASTPFAPSNYADWFDLSVCPVVANLSQRQSFRALARWPIDQLPGQADSEWRRRIDAIDGTVTRTAVSLAQAAEQSSASDSIAPILLRFIGQRPWRDLVSVDDYFGPIARLNLIEEIQVDPRLPEGRCVWDGPQFGSFHPYACPALRLPGDFISRCAIKRMEFWVQRLWRHLSRIHEADRQAPLAAIRRSLTDLESGVSALRGQLLEGRLAERRSACMALVQIYQALRRRHCPSEEVFPWLADASPPSHPGGRLHGQLLYFDDGAIADAAMAALSTLQSIDWEPCDVEMEIDEARRGHLLCIVDGAGRRELYWRQELVEADCWWP